MQFHCIYIIRFRAQFRRVKVPKLSKIRAAFFPKEKTERLRNVRKWTSTSLEGHSRPKMQRDRSHRARSHPPRRDTPGDRVKELDKEGLQKRLFELVERTGYVMVQENGQRRYGGPCPGWGNDPPPPASAELFVSRIPSNCFEDVLVPLFEAFGRLYEVRMMLDFDGTHRGFAYVKFCRTQDAIAAMHALDKHALAGSGRTGIRVSESRNNCEVEVSNLPWTGVRERLEPLVQEHTEGVRAVRWTCATRALLEYESHRAAAVARRKLLAILPDQCGREVRVQLVRHDRPNLPRHQQQPMMGQATFRPQQKPQHPLTESAEEYWARRKALQAQAAPRSSWPLVPVASPSFGTQPFFWPPQNNM
ncbi:dead end protein homolog 1-like [Neocloeon triangulifer]|uniref:dead end protein homolog 1-like n=1 Tax=Neocloeon triangulifer TaxID=2078957 RepID=UPI00286EEA07|nr:dead end protein homolog 1-like [Neocloeon triangulifer]